jgi:hypothetical protein
MKDEGQRMITLKVKRSVREKVALVPLDGLPPRREGYSRARRRGRGIGDTRK